MATKKNELSNRMEDAVKTGSVSKIQVLISEIPKDFKYERGRTMLHMAGYFGKPEAMEVLAPVAPDIDIQDYQGSTALHLAARTADLACVKILLANQAKVDVLDTYGETPLHKAAHGTDKQSARVAVVAELLSRSPELNRGNLSDQTELHIAAQSGNKELVVSLLSKGADPKLKAAGQIGTPEKAAADAGHLEVAEILKQATSD